MNKTTSALAIVALLALSGAAFGQAVITNGTPANASGSLILGVQSLGQLNAAAGTGGFRTNNGGASGAIGIAYYDAAYHGYYDATSPGCLCEGWGVSASGAHGYANTDSYGTSNIFFDSFTSSLTNIVSTTHLGGSTLSVSQDYHVATATNSLFEDTVTLTNTGSSTLTDVRYDRVMDWDVPHTEFNEFVTIAGWPATNLEFTNDNGFDSGDPLFHTIVYYADCPVSANFTDCGPHDHGAQFIFNFGSLAGGESKTFEIYYGYAPNEIGAINALSAVGAEVYSLGQQNIGGLAANDSNTFIFGFKGVGGTPVEPIPEPASMVLFGTGLLAVARRLRKR